MNKGLIRWIIGTWVMITPLIMLAVVVLFDDTSTALSVKTERPTWAAAFVHDYELRHGGVDFDTETMLLHGTNASCGDLVAKSNLSQVWQRNVDRDMSSDQSATVIELAVQYYCPEFKHLFTGDFVPKGM